MEVDGETIVPGGDTAKVLEAIEHSLDGIPAFIEVRGEAVFPHARDLRRDVGRRVLGRDFLAHGVGVVSLVTVDKLGGADLIEQRIRGDAIGNLTASQKKRDRAAGVIGQRVDLGGTPAA